MLTELPELFLTVDILMTVVILFVLISTIKIILSIIKQNQHFKEEEIQKYYDGNLDKYSEEYEAISTHLGICSKCRKVFEDISL